MEKYLFIVRNPSGKELYSTELFCPGNLISIAQGLMDSVRGIYHDELVECCEIWSRTEHRSMILIATAF